MGQPMRATPPAPDRPARLVSLDAYRGIVMLLMASAGLTLPAIAEHHTDSRIFLRI